MPMMNLFKRSSSRQKGQAPSKDTARRRTSSSSSTTSRRSSTGDTNPTAEQPHRRCRGSALLGKIRRIPATSVEDLVSERRWTELARALKTESGRDEVLSDSAPSLLLHRACRTGATPEVVRALCAISPSLTSVRDSRTGRTALHEACVASACPVTAIEPEVVQCLLDFDQGRGEDVAAAAATRDERGRLPLHLAAGAVRDCCSFDDDVVLDGSRLAGPPLENAEIILLVLRAHPDAVNEDDDDEVTPIEYSILAGADRKTVRVLRKSSEVLRKRDEAERRRRAAKVKARFAAKRQTCAAAAASYHRPRQSELSLRKVKRGAMAA